MSRGTLEHARSLLVSHTGLSPSVAGLSRTVLLPYEYNRVLFVERSGELRLLARLSTSGVEP